MRRTISLSRGFYTTFCSARSDHGENPRDNLIVRPGVHNNVIARFLHSNSIGFTLSFLRRANRPIQAPWKQRTMHISCHFNRGLLPVRRHLWDPAAGSIKRANKRANDERAIEDWCGTRDRRLMWARVPALFSSGCFDRCTARFIDQNSRSEHSSIRQGEYTATRGRRTRVAVPSSLTRFSLFFSFPRPRFIKLFHHAMRAVTNCRLGEPTPKTP